MQLLHWTPHSTQSQYYYWLSLETLLKGGVKTSNKGAAQFDFANTSPSQRNLWRACLRSKVWSRTPFKNHLYRPDPPHFGKILMVTMKHPSKHACEHTNTSKTRAHWDTGNNNIDLTRATWQSSTIFQTKLAHRETNFSSPNKCLQAPHGNQSPQLLLLLLSTVKSMDFRHRGERSNEEEEEEEVVALSTTVTPNSTGRIKICLLRGCFFFGKKEEEQQQ